MFTMLTARAVLIAHEFATQQQKFLLYPFNLISLFFIVFRINNISYSRCSDSGSQQPAEKPDQPH